MDDHLHTGSEQTDEQRPAGEGHNLPRKLTRGQYRARLWRSREWHLKAAFMAGVEVVRHREVVEQLEAELKLLEEAQRDRRP